MNQRGQTKQAVAGAVRGHQDAVQVGVLSYPFEFGNTADIAGVRPDDIDCLLLD